MALDNVFRKAAKTVFTVFKSLQAVGALYVEKVNNGFDPPSESTFDAIVIFDSWEEEDAVLFKEKIQPTDIKGLLQGEGFLGTMKSGNAIRYDGRDTTIVEYVVDPAKALYTLLLRRP